MLFVCTEAQDWLNVMFCCLISSSSYENFSKKKLSLIATDKHSSHVSMGLSDSKILALYFPNSALHERAKKWKGNQFFIHFFAHLLQHPCLTCGDDSNAQVTWYQLSIWLVLIHAVVSLRPGHQPMHDFTEHPITTYAHHPEKALQHRTLDPLGQTASPWKRLNAHERHAVPPWFNPCLTTMSLEKGIHK